jgi:CDP-diacylglycerol--serine O-phosphatidyltransferase
MKAAIPNAITLANLFAGCLAIVFWFEERPDISCLLMLLAALFDFLDGFIARALGVSSELGKQLDSLADVVSFGVVPGLLAWTLSKDADLPRILSFLSLLMVPASALRLGRFNLDSRQSQYFIGLPTPANGLFWSGFYMAVYLEYPLTSHLAIPETALSLSILFALLLNSPLYLLSLKIKQGRLQSPQWIMLFIFFMITAYCLIYNNIWLSLPFCIASYILVSIGFQRQLSSS